MARDPPPEVMASWPAPNLYNPKNRGNALAVMVSMLLVLALFTLALRVYSRMFFRRSFGADDWMILPATVTFIGISTLTILGNLRYGWGYHSWDLTIAMRERALLVSWISEIVLTWCLTLTKLSLCFFYLRLLAGTNKSLCKRIIFLLMGVIVFWGIGFTVAIIAQCSPVRAVYMINLPGEKCVDRHAGIIAHAAIDIASDLAIYVLPARQMWQLQMPPRQKALMTVPFALGALVCTASILRLPATLHSMSDYDVTWHMWNSYVWTDLECGLAIVVACMPSLTPLLVRFVVPPPPKFRPQYGFSGHHAAHSYPLADISTTACAGGQDWWHSKSESSENIVACELIGEGAITKTTIIEQTVCDGQGRAMA